MLDYEIKENCHHPRCRSGYLTGFFRCLFQCVLRQLERRMGSGKGYLFQHLGWREVHFLHDPYCSEECAGCVPWAVRYGLADGLGQY